jgi:pimeloyl-ACP methyl ester carboxylesterase
MARSRSRIKRIFAGFALLLMVAALAGASFQWLASRSDLAATAPPGRLVDVGGYRLHVWCAGSAAPGTPAVLFDSGLGGDAFDWINIAPEIAKFTQACTYDRAGMGYSDPGPTPRTSGQIAAELTQLIRNSGIARPVVLVGLSFGGFNTRIVASEHPDLVAGLVLVSASHENQGERYAEAGAPSGKPPAVILKLGPVAASLGILRLLRITLGAPPEQADAQVRDFVRATAYRTSRYYAMASELEHTTESGIEVAATRRQLTMPLVVVSAGNDSGVRGEINRELQADLATLSTRACQVIAEDSGHGIGNQPELAVKAIRDVLMAVGDEDRKPGC